MEKYKGHKTLHYNYLSNDLKEFRKTLESNSENDLDLLNFVMLLSEQNQIYTKYDIDIAKIVLSHTSSILRLKQYSEKHNQLAVVFEAIQKIKNRVDYQQKVDYLNTSTI